MVPPITSPTRLPKALPHAPTGPKKILNTIGRQAPGRISVMPGITVRNFNDATVTEYKAAHNPINTIIRVFCQHASSSRINQFRKEWMDTNADVITFPKGLDHRWLTCERVLRKNNLLLSECFQEPVPDTYDGCVLYHLLNDHINLYDRGLLQPVLRCIT